MAAILKWPPKSSSKFRNALFSLTMYLAMQYINFMHQVQNLNFALEILKWPPFLKKSPN